MTKRRFYFFGCIQLLLLNMKIETMAAVDKSFHAHGRLQSGSAPLDFHLNNTVMNTRDISQNMTHNLDDISHTTLTGLKIKNANGNMSDIGNFSETIWKKNVTKVIHFPSIFRQLENDSIESLVPSEWKSMCTVNDVTDCLKPNIGKIALKFIKNSKTICLRCNVQQYDYLNFLHFRNFTSEQSIKHTFAIDIHCGNNGEITLPWPMRADKLLYLSVDNCLLRGFSSELYDNSIQRIPDTLRYISLTNSVILVDIMKFTKNSAKVSNMTKAAECGPESVFEAIRRNMTYKFEKLPPDLLEMIKKKFVSKTAREYHRGITSTRNSCSYKNMYNMDRSISRTLGSKHDSILLQNSKFDNLRYFNLSNVRIKNIPDKLKDWRLFFPKLKYLDLSRNGISNFQSIVDFGIPSEDSSVGTFDLTYNNITTITIEELNRMKQHKYLKVDIRHNPFRCDCNMKDFIHYFKHPNNFTRMGSTPQYNYLRHLKCQSPEHLEGRIIAELKTDELGCRVRTTTILAAPIIALCILVLILVTFMVIVIKYRKEIVILAFTRFHILLPCQKVEDPDNKKYDAFIAYSQTDANWVLKTFAPRLETPNNGGPAFKLCLHHRDFALGAAIADNIVQSVEASKHTILVISENFLKSEWCLLEFRTAFHQSLLEKKRHLILVMLEDLPENKIDADLKRCMKTLTYVKIDDRFFWDKVVFALSDKKKKVKQDGNRRELNVELGNLNNIVNNNINK